SRVTWMWPSAVCSFTPAGRCVRTWPLGPWTTTVLPFISNFTPCGSGIGLFPMRDIFQTLLFKRVLQAGSTAEFHAASAISLWPLALGSAWNDPRLVNFLKHREVEQAAESDSLS